MSQPPNPPPRPSGLPPPSILLYALCLVPITAFAGWVVTYGTDEEALERKLREKYGNDIELVEGRKDAMSQVYQSLIKNPGSSEEQETRLQQILRGGRGDMKRHEAIDKRFYGTEEGLKLRQKQAEEIEKLRAEERERARKLKKKRKNKKKQKEEGGEGETSDADSEENPETSASKKKEAAAMAVGAVALASAANAKAKEADAEAPIEVKTVNPFANVKTKKQKRAEEKKKKKAKKNGESSIELSQVATITAVAGVAAMVGFLLGGSRRQ